MLIFDERGKPKNPEKNLWEQSKERANNLTHSWPEPGPRRWEVSAIITTPSLLPFVLPDERDVLQKEYSSYAQNTRLILQEP